MDSGSPRLVLSGLTAVALALGAGCAAPRSTAPAAPAATTPASVLPSGLSRDDEVFLEDVQQRTFRWFWETTNRRNGLVPDRWPTPSFSSVAAVGFGLTAYTIGAERGWVARDSAADRTLATLRFFWNAPQGPAARGVTGYKGFFYHFLDMQTGERFQDVELSTIDTGLFLYGALAARAYFTRDTPKEREIRSLATRLYERVDWRWAQPYGPRIVMGWHPETGFIRAEYTGYNEAQFLYLLALGSPTHPVHESAWPAFTDTYHWAAFEGFEMVNFAPLFGHQYTASWVDLRGIQDPYMRARGIDYFENGRRATLAQRAYAIRNPRGFVDYGPDLWGLTASDGPKDTTMVLENGQRVTFQTYSARGAAADEIRDDGTLVPTAAGGSVPFAPDETIRALRAMRDRYGARVYTRYGFKDAFNPTFGRLGVRPAMGAVEDGVWVDADYLGIDQGPILLAIENHRTGLVWGLLRRDADLVRGLRRAGFTGGWLGSAPPSTAVTAPRPSAAPRPDPLIVLLGSSTVEGWGARSRENRWAGRYRAHVRALDPDADVYNFGVGGYTTYHLLPTGTPAREGRPAVDTFVNVTRALRLRPDAIIVNLGSNDRAYGFANAEQLANFEAIRQAAAGQGVPVWFTTTQPRSIDGTGIADQMAVRDSLRARYPGRVIDFWTGIATPAGTLDPRWDSGDRLHLNDAGHGLLFERVRDARVFESLRR